MNVHLENDDGDGYRLNTYLSPYVEDAPWTRQDLTNDVVEEAIHNLVEKVEEEKPHLHIVSVDIEEITTVRKVEIT